jgi:DNA-binding NarL/FixJ family response regulator
MEKDRPTYVLLVGEHALVRAGIRMLLEKAKTMQVQGEVIGEQALALALQKKPDLMLQDIDQSPVNCFDLFQDIRAKLPCTHIVAMTAISDAAILRMAYRFGVGAVVPKQRPAGMLFSAIETVLAGEVWIDKALLPAILDGKSAILAKPGEEEQARKARITRRELDVVRLIGRGYRNKQIAELLGISEATVRHHLSSIFNKLDVSHRIELLSYLHRNKLLISPETPSYNIASSV